MSPLLRSGVSVVLLSLLGTRSAWAKPFTLRLMCGEQPERLVSDLETKEPAKSTEEKDTREAPADLRYVGWMRGITLDGKDVFRITYKGAFLKRSAVISADLEDGEHVLNPGEHRFRVTGGRLVTDDPDLRSAGEGLDLLCYPVTLLGVDASAVRQQPLTLKRIPLQVVVKHGDQMILPTAQTFDPLVLYMATNERGAPYRIEPTGQAFRVTAAGVRVVDTDESQAALSGVTVENRFTVGLPTFRFPLVITTRRDHKVGVKIYGLSGEAQVLTREDKETRVSLCYSRTGSAIKAGHGAPSEALPIEGDVAAFPWRMLRVDARHPASAEPRILVASWRKQAFLTGEVMDIRVRYQDSPDVPTFSPADVAVFLRQRPVLREDGEIDCPDLGESPRIETWSRLACRQAPGEPVYRVRVPDRPTSIYLCRLVVDRCGQASPESLLAADFWIAISSDRTPGTLSLFTDSLRRAYQAGETLEFNAVLKNRQPIHGTLEVLLDGPGTPIPIVRKDLPEQPPGHHTFTFRITPESTARLAQGNYRLEARLGPMTSHPCPIEIRQDVPKTHFPIFHYSWGGCHHASTVSRREENPRQRESELRRNMRRLADMQVNVVSVVEWLDYYEFRESNTPSAVAEQMMRNDLGLPASELAVSRTNFEILQDEMVRLGQRHFPQSFMSAFGFRSLKHSIDEDRLHEMRKYTLLAQDYRRYPNFMGFLTPKDQVAVLGNSETGDPRWGEREQALRRNFKARHGFDAPRQDQVVAWFHGDRSVRERLGDVEARWMAWVDWINDLLPGLQRSIREAVREVKPDVRIGAMTSNSFSAVMGEHISRMHAEMDVNYNAVGFGDFGRRHPIEEVVETMLGRCVGFRQAQWRNMCEWATKGQAMAKAHFFKNLLSDVDGFGYYSTAGDLGVTGPDWRYDEYSEFNRWLAEYGDWYQLLELDAPIGVYYSYTDGAHELPGIRDLTTTKCLAMGAVYELIRAHRIAPILDEDRVRQGDLRRYRILLLPGVRLMPDDVRTAIEEFIRGGGIVLCDEDTTVAIEGATKFPKNFQAMLYPYQKIGEQYDGNTIFWEAYKRTQGEVARLNELLKPYHQPFADADRSRILTSTLVHGDGRYVFVVNDDQPYWSEKDYFGVQQFILPNKATIRLRDTSGTVYSLLEGRRVEGTVSGAERTVQVDFEFTGAQVYAVLPRPLDSLRVEVSETVRPGEAARVRAQALGAGGEILRAAVPFEIRVVDPSGQTVYQAFRSTSVQGYEESFPVGLNAPRGEWRIEAHDRLGGSRSSAAFTVAGEGAPVDVTEAGDVIVTDGARIQGFLEKLKGTEDGLWIILSADQPAAVSSLAERCAEGLRERGIKAEVKRLDAPGVVEPQGRITHPLARHAYKDASPATHIRHHVLLLGAEGENQLIEEICDTPILLRRFSRNYPGDGKALVQMAFSAFAAGYHTILVLSNDPAGLGKGVERLLGFGTFGQEPDILRTAAAPASTAPWRPASPPTTSPRPNTVQEQEGMPVSTIAFSPDGGFFAVGCDWYFHNLFLFDRSGKLLWKQKLGRKAVQQVTLSRGAERICAGTDQGTYLLNRQGEVLWRFHQGVLMNPAGDLLFSTGTDLTLALRPDGTLLWKDDPWQEETDPWKLNESGQLAAVGFLDDGKTVLVRNGLDFEYRDATTNRVLRRFTPQATVSLERGQPAKLQPFPATSFRATPDGRFIALLLADGEPSAFVYNQEGHLVQDAFLAPAYYAAYESNDRIWLSPEGRLYVLGKDTVYAVREDREVAWSYRFGGPLVSGGALSNDGRFLALAAWNGDVVLLETARGQPVWQRHAESGAEVAFSPDGQILAAGSKTGVVRLFTLAGEETSRYDLRPGSYIENIETWWAAHDRSVKPLNYGIKPPWHETVQRDVPLSENLLGLADNRCALKDVVDWRVPGEEFGTYLVQMKYRTRAGDAAFRVACTEWDADGQARPLRSTVLQARPFPEELHWLLKLSDRPRHVQIRAESTAAVEVVFDDLQLRQLVYPSPNYLIHRGAFRLGKTPEVMENAPVSAGVFHMRWGSHTVVWADPFYLMDGHVFRKQKELDDGWWFGGPVGGAQSVRMKITPCAIVIDFPEPKPVSHVALFDDEDGDPTERVCVQAWVETKDLRRQKTEAEERDLKPGYWRTVAKGRWNHDPFQIFSFDPQVTSKIRLWILRGPLKLDEVEIYGPEERQTKSWFDPAWVARLPVRVNRPADLAEVEFQALSLTQPNGEDVRVVNPVGKEVPHVIKLLSPSGTSSLVFQTDQRVGTYYLYLGNDEAKPVRYDWVPRGGIWMESYARPQKVDNTDTRQVWNENLMLRIFEVAKAEARATQSRAEAEGKPLEGATSGFVPTPGLGALPNAITRTTFFLRARKPERISFMTNAHSHVIPALLRMNGKTVIGSWNAFDPANPPPQGAMVVPQNWGDAELSEGVNQFEYYFIGHTPPHQVAPLTFRQAESRSQYGLLRSGMTCFPGALGVTAERIELQETRDIGSFYLSRAGKYLEKDQLFRAQEMLLFARRFTRDAAGKDRLVSLEDAVRRRTWASQWSMLRNDPGRTGFIDPAPEGGPAGPSDVSLQFPRKTAEHRSEDQVESGIAATGLGTFFGDCFHQIHQFGGWSVTTGGIIRAAPLVYGERVFCGSMDGILYCLTPSHGELVWRFPTGDGIVSSALGIDGLVVFGSLDGTLYALDAIDGQLKWKHRTDGWIESSPASDGQRVFIGSNDDSVHAVDLHTGRLLWKFLTGFDVRSTPCVGSGTVYVTSDDGHLYALNASDGQLVWKTRLGGYLPAGPVLGRTTLVAAGENGAVHALEASTGKPIWKQQLPEAVEASPAILGAQVFVPCDDNHLYVFRLSDGAVLSRVFPFTGEVLTRSFRCSPAYHAGALWLGGTTHVKNGVIQRWEK